MWDRLPHSTELSCGQCAEVITRKARWVNVVGGKEALHNRLASAGLSDHDCLLCAKYVGPKDLPPWTSTLSKAFRVYSDSHDHDEFSWATDSAYDAISPLPFQEILIDFVRIGRDQLRDRAGSSFSVFTRDARRDLEHSLLNQLTFLSNLALGQLYYEYRFKHDPVSAFEWVWSKRPPTTEIYRGFVTEMRSKFAEYFESYPVLARLICQSVDQWVSNCSSMAKAIDDDFPTLREEFDWDIPRREGAVKHAELGLSDRHYDGQSVVAFRFRNGVKVVYKPRSIRPEIAFFAFLQVLNRLGLPHPLKTLRTIDCGNHGWIEFVEALPCESDAEVKRFYRRIGELLAAVHVLAVTDMHFENLIATGEDPVIVDLETMLDVSGVERSDARSRPGQGGGFSIFRSGFIPRWQKDPDGRRFDLSALAADETQNSGVRPRVWINTNTDTMQLAEDMSPEVSGNHRPHLANSPASADRYYSIIEAGFVDAYSLLLDCRAKLLTNNQLIRMFEGLELRVLVRSTQTYSRLLLHLLHPEFLKDGVVRSVELEWLSRPLTGSKTSPKDRKAIYDLEIVAMEKLDVPHFVTFQWAQEGFIGDDKDVERLWRQRDGDTLRNRLRSLSEYDMQVQVEALKGAMRARFSKLS